MPLLPENAHAIALLSRVTNLVKEAVEHLNSNQTPVLTMDQPLSAIAKEIQRLWPDSFCNNKYVIMMGGGGGGGGSSCWDGRESGWIVLNAKCNHNCWNSVAESFVKASYLGRTRHAHQVTVDALHILQQSAFLSYLKNATYLHLLASEFYHCLEILRLTWMWLMTPQWQIPLLGVSLNLSSVCLWQNIKHILQTPKYINKPF